MVFEIILILVGFIIGWLLGVRMTAKYVKRNHPEVNFAPQHDDNYINDRRKIFHPSMHEGND